MLIRKEHYYSSILYSTIVKQGNGTKIVEGWVIFTRSWRCMKKIIFVLRKFVKRAEKIIFSLVFVCFHFTEISYFLSFPSNENVRKQHLPANAYFCINMKFSYTIAGRKDEIFHVVL